MGIEEAIIDERGRITIPYEERKRLGLVPGTKVLLKITDKTIILRKYPTREEFIEEFCGIINHSVENEQEEDLKQIWISKNDET